ncbi:MAG: DMT family transporter [Eubacterium sp.]|nr:DMT family transporter [Eubacterium sp.]
MKKIIILAGAIGLSFSAIFVRLANANSVALAFYRMFFAAALLVPVALWKHKEEIKHITGKQWLLCAVSGIFLGFHFTCFFESLDYTTIASTTVLVDTEVFFVTLIGCLFEKEKITLQGIIGILLAFSGSLIITLGAAGESSNMVLGDALALIGAVFIAIHVRMGKHCRTNISTTVYTAIVYFFAAVCLGVEMMLRGISFGGYDSYNYLLALGLTVFCTFLGHSIFNWGLKYEKATFVSMAKLLEPVFASAMGAVLFREIPDVRMAIGCVLVIAGIVYYILRGNKEESVSASGQVRSGE